jgi:hypothetical protein
MNSIRIVTGAIAALGALAVVGTTGVAGTAGASAQAATAPARGGPISTAMAAVVEELSEAQRENLAIWAGRLTERGEPETDRRPYAAETDAQVGGALGVEVRQAGDACELEPGANLLSANTVSASGAEARVTVTLTERTQLGFGTRILAVDLVSLDGSWTAEAPVPGMRARGTCQTG